MEKKKISVYIVEDYPLSRLDLLLELRQNCNILGSFACAEDCLEQMKIQPADVVIMDLNLSGMNGVEATKFIKCHFPQTKVVAYSNHDETKIVMSMIYSGASAYLTKETKLKLPLVIEIINAGVLLLDAKVAMSIKEHMPAPCINNSIPLTEREKEVLVQMVDGKMNPEIAKEFFISRNTVKAHVRNIMKKLSAQNRTQAIVKAIKTGLI